MMSGHSTFPIIPTLGRAFRASRSVRLGTGQEHRIGASQSNFPPRHRPTAPPPHRPTSSTDQRLLFPLPHQERQAFFLPMGIEDSLLKKLTFLIDLFNL